MEKVTTTINGKPITFSSQGGRIEVKVNINPIFLKPISNDRQHKSPVQASKGKNKVQNFCGFLFQ